MQDEEQAEVLAALKQRETLGVRANGLNLQGKDEFSVTVRTRERSRR